MKGSILKYYFVQVNLIYSIRCILLINIWFFLSKLDKPGTYYCKIPIVVNENFEQPYYYIDIVGELLAPEITFDPEILTLKPVPLGIEVVEKFIIKHVGYEQ